MKYAILLSVIAGTAQADAPVVTATSVQPGGGFSVTLTHPDSGWDHYADGWRIEDAAGNVLGLRVLAHPHVNEQPFTRSLGGVQIPTGTQAVFLRTRCLVDGWSKDVVEIVLE